MAYLAKNGEERDEVFRDLDRLIAEEDLFAGRAGSRIALVPARRGPARKQMGRCSVENCGRWAVVRGFCDAHYQRWKRYGTPLAGSPVFGCPTLCRAVGCNRQARSKGWCVRHYLRAWRRGGEL
jgi:hypothetical protein